MSERPRIGFVGLGLMGAPMVRRLVLRGWQVAVWNLEPERYAEVKDVTVLDGPHQVREASDIVIFCILNGDAVEECCFGPKGLARAGSGASLLIDCSTINPDRTLALAGGMADSTVLKRIYPQQAARDYEPPRGYARQLDKDLINVMAFVKAHGLELPLIARAASCYHDFAHDRPMQDSAAVARLYEKGQN